MRLHWLAVARRRPVQVLHNVQCQDENQQREGLSPGQCPDTAWPISRRYMVHGKGQSKIGSLDRSAARRSASFYGPPSAAWCPDVRRRLGTVRTPPRKLRHKQRQGLVGEEM